jgi:hypothetical protein
MMVVGEDRVTGGSPASDEGALAGQSRQRTHFRWINGTSLAASKWANEVSAARRCVWGHSIQAEGLEKMCCATEHSLARLRRRIGGGMKLA